MSEQYQALAAPFDRTHTKQGPVTYITGEQAVSRLNDVLGFDQWSFKVLMHGYNDDADELWVLGELTLANGQVVQQFGSQKPNRYSSGKNEGKIIDYGFDLKGAATDALKKCASLRGVGLYLHEKDGAPATVRPVQGATQQAGVPAGGASSSTARESAPVVAPAAPPAASRREPGLYEVAAQMGFSRDEVISSSQKHFDNREPQQLNKAEKQNLLRLMEEDKKKELVTA